MPRAALPALALTALASCRAAAPADPRLEDLFERCGGRWGIYFRDLGWPYAGKEDGTLAQTNTSFRVKSGLVEYADIEINSGSTRFSVSDTDDGVDLQAVLTHEVGHYIGLAHSADETSERTCALPAFLLIPSEASGTPST